tara:strand:- start:300 stop:413 length:114 start_codon:yes stop_codon:yes gene_type:complete
MLLGLSIYKFGNSILEVSKLRSSNPSAGEGDFAPFMG